MSLGSIHLDQDLDRWLTTPPEEKESHCRCFECGEELYPEDDYYRLDDEVYCSECAEEWLEQFKGTVDGEMAYGNVSEV